MPESRRRFARATMLMTWVASGGLVAGYAIYAMPAHARKQPTRTVTVEVVVRPYFSPKQRAELHRRTAIDMKPWYGIPCPTDAWTYQSSMTNFGNHPGQHPSWEAHLATDCPGWEHWRDVAIAEKRYADVSGETARDEAENAKWEAAKAKVQADHDAAIAPYMPK